MKKLFVLLLAVMMLMSTSVMASPNRVVLTALTEDQTTDNQFTYGSKTVTANFASTENKDVYIAVYNNDSGSPQLQSFEVAKNTSPVNGVVSTTLDLEGVTRSTNNIVKAFCWSPDGNMAPHSASLVLSYLPCTVSFRSARGVAPETVGVAPNGSITLPTMENVGANALTGWALNGTTYEPGTSYTVTDDVTFEAVWEESPIEEFWADHMGTDKLGDGTTFVATENTIAGYSGANFQAHCRIATGSITIKVSIPEGDSGNYDLYLYNKSNVGTTKGTVTMDGVKIGEIATEFAASTTATMPEIKGPLRLQLTEGENQIVITSSNSKQYDFYGVKLVYAGE